MAGERCAVVLVLRGDGGDIFAFFALCLTEVSGGWRGTAGVLIRYVLIVAD